MSKQGIVSASEVSELSPDFQNWKQQAELQKVRAVKALQASLRMYELNEKIKSTLDLTTRLLDLESEAELFSEAVNILTSEEGMGFRDASLLLIEEGSLHTACSTLERGKKVFTAEGDNRYARWLAAEGKGETFPGGEADQELMVTLRSRGRLLGLLEVVQHEREKVLFEGLDSFVEWRRDLVTRIGEVVSMLIDNLRLNQELKRQSTVDALTGAYSRSFFLQRAEDEVNRALRYGRALSLVFIDIDHFKEINDEQGHLAGDLVLRELGSLFRRNVRNADVLGRYGGDEFIWLLPETDLDMAVCAADKVVNEVRVQRFELSGKGTSRATISVTASLGAAGLLPGEDVESLLSRADEALYKAKTAGRDRLVS
jgi:diguanylate cyclase (GGDEF)-like protein